MRWSLSCEFEPEFSCEFELELAVFTCESEYSGPDPRFLRAALSWSTSCSVALKKNNLENVEKQRKTKHERNNNQREIQSSVNLFTNMFSHWGKSLTHFINIHSVVHKLYSMFIYTCIIFDTVYIDLKEDDSRSWNELLTNFTENSKNDWQMMISDIISFIGNNPQYQGIFFPSYPSFISNSSNSAFFLVLISAFSAFNWAFLSSSSYKNNHNRNLLKCIINLWRLTKWLNWTI